MLMVLVVKTKNYNFYTNKNKSETTNDLNFYIFNIFKKSSSFKTFFKKDWLTLE